MPLCSPHRWDGSLNVAAGGLTDGVKSGMALVAAGRMPAENEMADWTAKPSAK